MMENEQNEYTFDDFAVHTLNICILIGYILWTPYLFAKIVSECALIFIFKTTDLDQPLTFRLFLDSFKRTPPEQEAASKDSETQTNKTNNSTRKDSIR